jgi:hypothetical protein
VKDLFFSGNQELFLGFATLTTALHPQQSSFSDAGEWRDKERHHRSPCSHIISTVLRFPTVSIHDFR